MLSSTAILHQQAHHIAINVILLSRKKGNTFYIEYMMDKKDIHFLQLHNLYIYNKFRLKQKYYSLNKMNF
mgnify:CR=1 FL=1